MEDCFLLLRAHQVILGGGRNKLVTDREDGRDLTKEWVEMKKEEGESHAYVTTGKELSEVPEDTEYLLGEGTKL